MKRLSSLSWSWMNMDRSISEHPNAMCFAAAFLNPGYRNTSSNSLRFTSLHLHSYSFHECKNARKIHFNNLRNSNKYLYPSRWKAKTAFGPNQTLPSIRGVKCTPRKGNRGSGTYKTWKDSITR